MKGILVRLLIISLIIFGLWYFLNNYNNKVEGPNQNRVTQEELTKDKVQKIESVKSEKKVEILAKKPQKKDKTNTDNFLKNKKQSTPKFTLSKDNKVNKQTKLDEVTELVTEKDADTFDKPKNVEETTAKNFAESNMTIYLYEYGIDFSSRTMPAGKINFRVVNNGRLAHEFNVKTTGGKVINFGKIPPQETQNFAEILTAGSVSVFSGSTIDRQNNMVKTLEIN